MIVYQEQHKRLVRDMKLDESKIQMDIMHMDINRNISSTFSLWFSVLLQVCSIGASRV